MLIGLMSDTHDNLAMTDKAVKRMNESNVELVLHAGDYVAPFVVPRFKDLKSKLIGVFGNNDGDHELLQRRFSEYANLELRGNFAIVEAEGLKIALLHGTDKALMKVLIETEGLDFVVYGHSHSAAAYKKGRTMVVNPGEVCGYLSGKATFALLDTVKREAKILDL